MVKDNIDNCSLEINKDLIKHVAKLARINLTDEELDKFISELKEVLDVCNKLNDVDCIDVEPSFQPVKIKNVLRDDEVEKSLTQEEALRNTEHKKDGYFKGPRAV
jgi:aspartyl-tRNA(Asn)/glutamyl-tRNA(Gln) amidotransferase subunit C